MVVSLWLWHFQPGRAGWKDWNVVRYAREGDFVLVPNNNRVLEIDLDGDEAALTLYDWPSAKP